MFSTCIHIEKAFYKNQHIIYYLKWSHIDWLQQDGLNQAWLEDMALRFLCVLSLDRFGDFVSDEVSFGFLYITLLYNHMEKAFEFEAPNGIS